MLSNPELFYLLKNKASNKGLVGYRFHFASLLPVHLIHNVRHLDLATFTAQYVKENYILIKQSYIILSWLAYMSSSTLGGKKNNLTFASLPIKLKKYTVTKAPMAHKTNSKEQLGFRFFYFKASFKAHLTTPNALASTNVGLLFALTAKKMFPIFSTNMLFLKSYTIFYFIQDSNFFSFHQFLNNKKN